MEKQFDHDGLRGDASMQNDAEVGDTAETDVAGAGRANPQDPAAEEEGVVRSADEA